MNKTSLLLLPTLLAVSASARKPVQRESSNVQSADSFRTVRGKPKNFSIDLVFSIGK